MLSKFSVKNFKNFKDEIVMDFTASSYDFNPNSVANNVVKTAIIYGQNASGKSNFGFAIFDIVRHITSFNSNESFYNNYSNKTTQNPLVEFKYEFKFDNDILNYEYIKDDDSQLIDEILKINGKIFLSIKRSGGDKDVSVNFKGAESLNKDITSANISIINYVFTNAVLEDNDDSKIFYEFLLFVNKMLFFRSLSDNSFIGIEQKSSDIGRDIIDKNNIDYFQDFLCKAGIECNLSIRDENIVFDYGNDEFINFFEVASSGTKALALVYFWLQRIKNDQVKFLFIDEFDAFYHYELSEFIVQELKDLKVQVILTTHNTAIMSNNLLRPDCYFILDKDLITQINKKTEKELRRAHNLEKLYIGGKFL